MAFLLEAIADCFGTVDEGDTSPTLHLSEKISYYHDEPAGYTESEVIETVIKLIYDAKHQGDNLEQALDDNVKGMGWGKQDIARAVLAALERTLQAGKKMGPALQRAYDIALDKAQKMEELASEHPVMTGVFCAVVALGVLYLIWPAIIEVLGFGELGPIEDSFAAGWQALYGGRVPYGSLFSYLQRLGMTFK